MKMKVTPNKTSNKRKIRTTVDDHPFLFLSSWVLSPMNHQVPLISYFTELTSRWTCHANKHHPWMDPFLTFDSVAKYYLSLCTIVLRSGWHSTSQQESQSHARVLVVKPRTGLAKHLKWFSDLLLRPNHNPSPTLLAADAKQTHELEKP